LVITCLANIIQNSVTLETPLGPNVYFVFVTDDGLFYNGSFENYNAAHWTQYVVPMTLIGPNIYQGTFPNVPAGTYNIFAYAYSTTPDPHDAEAGFGTITWNGSTESDCLSDTNIELEVGVHGSITTISPGVKDDDFISTITPGVK